MTSESRHDHARERQAPADPCGDLEQVVDRVNDLGDRFAGLETAVATDVATLRAHTSALDRRIRLLEEGVEPAG